MRRRRRSYAGNGCKPRRNARRRTKRFRKIVRERIDGVIGGIDTVALTTDKTVMDALEALQDRLDSVSDMSSLQAELDKILETMNAASRAKA